MDASTYVSMSREDTRLQLRLQDILDYARRKNMVLFEGSYAGGGDLATFRWSRFNPNPTMFLDFASSVGARVLFYRVHLFGRRDVDECKLELDAVRDHIERLDLDESARKEYRSRLFGYLTRLNGFEDHLDEVGEILLQVKVDGDLYEYVEDEEWYDSFNALLDEIRSLHEELEDQDGEMDQDEDTGI